MMCNVECVVCNYSIHISLLTSHISHPTLYIAA